MPTCCMCPTEGHVPGCPLASSDSHTTNASVEPLVPRGAVEQCLRECPGLGIHADDCPAVIRCTEETPMPSTCLCPFGNHIPGCPLASSAGAGTYYSTGTAPPVPPARVPWVCPRCNRMNAPHVDVCACSDHAVVTTGEVSILPIQGGTGGTL